jgi:ribose 5-phosphate isomerase
MATNLFGDRVMNAQREERVAAEAAADLVGHGMTVGLCTGSTVAFLLPPLARRSLNIRCVATSPSTEHAARELGLRVEDFTSIERFDIAIDGADQISANGWLVKGGGVIADYIGTFDDPATLAARFASTPGIVEHGLFPRHMVTTVLVAHGESVDRIDFQRHS